MTLESAMAVLGTLTELRELRVVGLDYGIGEEDAEWMLDNWPELTGIYYIRRRSVHLASGEPSFQVALRFWQDREQRLIVVIFLFLINIHVYILACHEKKKRVRGVVEKK